MATSETARTFEIVKTLGTQAREGFPVSLIGLKLKRPVEAVSAKLAELGITPASETASE